jgi:hypothetical protein
VAPFFLQQATNLAFISGENSRSRISVRQLDSLTGFPVQADPPDVHETGTTKSMTWRHIWEMDGWMLIRLSIAGIMEIVDGISTDS